MLQGRVGPEAVCGAQFPDSAGGGMTGLEERLKAEKRPPEDR